MSSSVGWLTEKWPRSTSLSIAQVVIRCAATTGSLVSTSTRSPSSERCSHGTSGRSPSDQLGRQREADLGRPQVASAELLGPSERDDLAGVHHRDAIGQMLCLVHVVGGQEHGLAEVAQRADRRPRLPARRRVKAGRRLVEEDQIGIPDQRERQVEPPALAARQVPGARVALLAQLHQLDHLVDRAAPAVIAAVHLDQLRDRQVVLHAALLEHDSDALVELALGVRRVHAQHSHVAVAAFAVALEDLDDRCLARPVWSQQTEHLTPRDLEANPAHSLHLAIRLAQIAHLDGEPFCLCMGCFHARQRRRRRPIA